jgi:hypothetical protein
VKTAIPAAFEPRKTPVQQRSTVTVEAISEATIQVLLAVGLDRLTTTRVAARAGVSVGTLYQYYPNKQALLYAVLKVHSIKVAEAVEHACRANRRAAVPVLVAAGGVRKRETGTHGCVDGAICRRLGTGRSRSCAEAVKTRTSRADGCAGRSCGRNTGRHGVCGADVLFNDSGGDTRCVGGWCAGEDGGSIARRVARALSGIRGEVAAFKLRTCPASRLDVRPR